MSFRVFTTISLIAVASLTASAVALDVSGAQTQENRPWTYVSPYSDPDATQSSWWKNFGDPTLDTLITTARANSYDISAAMKRVDAARAQVGMAKSSYYPNIGISAGWTKERISGMTSSRTVPATTTDFFNASATASWEIDIFGKLRAGVNRSKASYKASCAEFDGVLLSVSAEIATTYFSYRVAQAQLAVALDHSSSQLKVVKIAEARHETGLASALDVAQAKTVYYSTLSTISPLRSQIHSLRNSLALLAGIPVESLPASLDTMASLPECAPIPLNGVPADILRQRPDIMESEQNIAAAAAALGVAKKDFLPTLSINGSIGTQSHDAGNLFKSGSLAYSIAPTLTWTVFNGFNRKYAVAEAKSQMEALIEEYHSTLQNAAIEVDNATYSYARSLETIADMNETEHQSREAYVLAVDLYKSGNSSFTNVADAQMSYLTYANQLITSRGNALTTLVSLYKALGGGISNLNI